MEKRKSISKKWRIVAIMGVVFGILGIIFVLFFIYIITTTKSDISDIPSSMSVMITSGDGNSNSTLPSDDNNLKYYDTLEEALKDTSRINKEYYYDYYQNPLKNQIMKFQDLNTLYLIYIPSKRPKSNEDIFAYTTLHIKDGRYSQPIEVSSSAIHSINRVYTCDCDDSVADYLVDQYTMGDKVYAENGNRIYYGAWENEKETKSMTIDGNAPDDIIPVRIEDRTYYFWYYSKTNLDDNLKKIKFSNFTLQQVIDALNIRYEKDKTMGTED